MRGPLLLLVMAAWLYATDMALIVGYDPSGATYQANGLYMAWLSGYAMTVKRPPSLVEWCVLSLSIALSLLQTGCDLLWTKAGPSAAICDDVTNRPITLVCAAAMLGATWALDNLTKVGRNG